MLRLIASVMIVLGLAACASPRMPAAPPAAVPPLAVPVQPAPFPQARIVETDRPLECVVYARAMSGIELFGDAGTWWRLAEGRYGRGTAPVPGAVLAFRPARKSTGHVAVITRVVSGRVVLASHANWLNQGRIHEDTPILDVSAGNDWSAVRVWHIPGQAWGSGVYPTHGFIYPRPLVTADR